MKSEGCGSMEEPLPEPVRPWVQSPALERKAQYYYPLGQNKLNIVGCGGLPTQLRELRFCKIGVFGK